jgi:hypothetical protein
MLKVSGRLVILGFFLIILAAVLNPGPPYQDPTPEMLAKEKAEDARAQRCMIAGSASVAFGGLAFLVAVLKQRNSDKN